MKARVIAAIDPGFFGAVCFLLGNTPVVFDPPVIKTKKSGAKKAKTEFDLREMKKMFRIFSDQEVVMGIEVVHPFSHEGSVSSFNFGAGYGAWRMCAVCNDFEVVDLLPRTWKQEYPELKSPSDNEEMKAELRACKSQYVVLKSKKDRKILKKDIDALLRKIKGNAKDAARELAASLYPDISEMFKLKKHDGRAEAVLMARYVQKRVI